MVVKVVVVVVVVVVAMESVVVIFCVLQCRYTLIFIHSLNLSIHPSIHSFCLSAVSRYEIEQEYINLNQKQNEVKMSCMCNVTSMPYITTVVTLSVCLYLRVVSRSLTDQHKEPSARRAFITPHKYFISLSQRSSANWRRLRRAHDREQLRGQSRWKLYGQCFLR